MAYNRFGPQSSPWASGAPPMYSGHSHAPPPPPPQYGTPAYGQSAPWNVTQPMRQGGGGGWGAPQSQPNIPHMQSQQRRGPIPGPTGKRGNTGSWDGPQNKRFAKQGGGRGGQGGHWRSGGGGGQKSQNRPFNRDNRRNNREVNRTKQNETQIERRQQHDQAQKAAESLDNKEYPIEQHKPEDSKTDDKNKNLDIDPLQEKYLLAVFGYVCQVCSVFLKDKSARFDHCQNENHLNKFKAAEEERVKKEENETKSKETEENKNLENTEETATKENETLENGDKTETTGEDSKNEELNEKVDDEAKDGTQTNQEEEIKTINEETAVIADQPNDESGDKPLSNDPVPQGVETPNPAPNAVNSQSYSGGEYTQNRGRGNYNRGGRGGHGRGGPRGGRGRNRGRGRK